MADLRELVKKWRDWAEDTEGTASKYPPGATKERAKIMALMLGGCADELEAALSQPVAEAVGYVTKEGGVVWLTEGAFSMQPKPGASLYVAPVATSSGDKALADLVRNAERVKMMTQTRYPSHDEVVNGSDPWPGFEESECIVIPVASLPRDALASSGDGRGES